MKAVQIVLWGAVALAFICIIVLGFLGKLPLPNFSFSLANTISYPDSKLYSVGEGSTNIQEISSIEVNWISGDVSVIGYDGEQIKFCETGSVDLKQDEKMRHLAKDGKLTIQFCAPRRLNFVKDFGKKSLAVYVPFGFKADELHINGVSVSIYTENLNSSNIQIESVSGSILAIGILSGDLRLETVSGRIKGEDCAAGELIAKTVSGSADIAGIFSNVKGKSVTGNIRISPGRDARKIDMESVSGRVAVELPENGGFVASYDSVRGSFSCDYPVTSSRKTVTYGNGNIDIKLETVSGSINIVKG